MFSSKITFKNRTWWFAGTVQLNLYKMALKQVLILERFVTLYTNWAVHIINLKMFTMLILQVWYTSTDHVVEETMQRSLVFAIGTVPHLVTQLGIVDTAPATCVLVWARAEILSHVLLALRTFYHKTKTKYLANLCTQIFAYCGFKSFAVYVVNLYRDIH